MNTSQNEILIFRTSAQPGSDVARMESVFGRNPQIKRWTVDTDDWEKVLRIESSGLSTAEVLSMLRSVDVMAAELL